MKRMDSLTTYSPGEVPWDLIAASFGGTLAAGEKVQLNQWLTLSHANLEKYRQWQRLWRKGLGDYEFYVRMDATASWNSLQERIRTGEDLRARMVVRRNFRKKLAYWTAAAVATGLLAVVGWLQYSTKPAVLYTTAANEQTTIALADGSAVTLKGGTALKVDSDYNGHSRMVELIRGEVVFEVRHMTEIPFIVRLGNTRVEDIGTSFTIAKNADSIRVMVQSGKVAFIDDATRLRRELSGGESLSFYDREKRFGDPDTAFRDTPLGDVLVAMRQQYGKEIRLADTALSKERINLHLAGESFETAIGVICASMHLRLSQEDGVYILTK
jgi:transmembrane sensor